MKKRFWILLLSIALSLLPMGALADTVGVTFTGTSGANDGMYYISPYYLSINGAPAVDAFCIDFNHWISNPTWTANTTPVTGPSYADTYNSGNPVVYQEMGWLASQYAANPADHVAIQHAIWDISAGALLFPTTHWYTDALNSANYNSAWGADGWTILTDVNKSSQEFLIHGTVSTPEPGSLLLLGVGLAGVSIYSRKKFGNRPSAC